MDVVELIRNNKLSKLKKVNISYIDKNLPFIITHPVIKLKKETQCVNYLFNLDLTWRKGLLKYFISSSGDILTKIKFYKIDLDEIFSLFKNVYHLESSINCIAYMISSDNIDSRDDYTYRFYSHHHNHKIMSKCDTKLTLILSQSNKFQIDDHVPSDINNLNSIIKEFFYMDKKIAKAVITNFLEYLNDDLKYEMCLSWNLKSNLVWLIHKTLNEDVNKEILNRFVEERRFRFIYRIDLEYIKINFDKVITKDKELAKKLLKDKIVGSDDVICDLLNKGKLNMIKEHILHINENTIQKVNKMLSQNNEHTHKILISILYSPNLYGCLGTINVNASLRLLDYFPIHSNDYCVYCPTKKLFLKTMAKNFFNPIYKQPDFSPNFDPEISLYMYLLTGIMTPIHLIEVYKLVSELMYNDIAALVVKKILLNAASELEDMK